MMMRAKRLQFCARYSFHAVVAFRKDSRQRLDV